jgi:hypothetical protein
MKRRHVLAVISAIAMLVLDCLSFPFLLGGGRPYVEYTLYLPGWLGERLLLFFMTTWGWPASPAGTSSLSYPWSVALLIFNWFCYAALGFVLGLRLGSVLERRERPQRPFS